jgi:hypothetical protein
LVCPPAPGYLPGPPERTIRRSNSGGMDRKRGKPVEDEEEFPGDTEDEEDEEEAAEPGAEAEEEGEASLDEILAKKPEERAAAEEEEEDESILTLGREDRIETLSVKVEPKKDTEFVCKNCHLVKPIRSQLKDKVRMFCRDCA